MHSNIFSDIGGVIVYDFNSNTARLFEDLPTMAGDPHGHVVINGVGLDITTGTGTHLPALRH